MRSLRLQLTYLFSRFTFHSLCLVFIFCVEVCWANVSKSAMRKGCLNSLVLIIDSMTSTNLIIEWKRERRTSSYRRYFLLFVSDLRLANIKSISTRTSLNRSFVMISIRHAAHQLRWIHQWKLQLQNEFNALNRRKMAWSKIETKGEEKQSYFKLRHFACSNAKCVVKWYLAPMQST